jgi:hypothetical protein
VRTDLVVAAITSQIPDVVADDEILLSDADLRNSRLAPNRRSLNLYDSSGPDSEKTWPRARFNAGKHFADARAIVPMKKQGNSAAISRLEAFGMWTV